MRVHYRKPHNLTRLHEELLRDVPAVRPTIIGADGRPEAAIVVEGLDDDVWLTVPDTVNVVNIDAVVNAHDPRPLTVVATPNPVAPNALVTVAATLPTGSSDTTVTFQVQGGMAYPEPVTGGQASHAYAFASAGSYRITASSTHHGSSAVEVIVR